MHRLAPAPETPGLSDVRRGALELRVRRDRDLAEHAPRARFLEHLGRVAPAGLVAACALAVAALVALTVLVPDGSEPVQAALPVRAEPAAVRALDTLAVAALAAEAPEVRADQFVYVRSLARTNEGGLGDPAEVGALHEREIWLSQEPSTSQSGLIREFGQDWPMTSGGYVVAAGPSRPTYAWVSTLPADPDQIIEELGRYQQPGDPLTRDQYVFERIGDLISEGMVPPRLAAALYEAVTKLPGVVRTPHAEDAIGRSGFGISRTDEFSGITTTWVFRTGSPTPIGTLWHFPGPSSAPDQRVLFGATAVLQRGVVDRLGEPLDAPTGA